MMPVMFESYHCHEVVVMAEWWFTVIEVHNLRVVAMLCWWFIIRDSIGAIETLQGPLVFLSCLPNRLYEGCSFQWSLISADIILQLWASSFTFFYENIRRPASFFPLRWNRRTATTVKCWVSNSVGIVNSDDFRPVVNFVQQCLKIQEGEE